MCSSVARKFLQVHVPVGHEQELGERQLPFAEDPERAGHRLARVALLDDRRGQRVIAGLAVRPEPLDRRHHQREQRRQQLLQQIADEEILLPRLADDRRRDRSRRARCAIRCTCEHRVVVLQRVVAVVIAERPFGPPHARRHLADQRELGVGDQRMRPAGRAPAAAARRRSATRASARARSRAAARSPRGSAPAGRRGTPSTGRRLAARLRPRA